MHGHEKTLFHARRLLFHVTFAEIRFSPPFFPSLLINIRFIYRLDISDVIRPPACFIAKHFQYLAHPLSQESPLPTRSDEKATWQPAKNYAFRPFAREQQFTAIYDIHRVEAYSFAGRNAGLAETRHGTPDRIHPHDGSIEGVAQTGGGRSFTSSRLTRNLSGCHPDVPSVGFPRQELGPAERQEVVKGANYQLRVSLNRRSTHAVLLCYELRYSLSLSLRFNSREWVSPVSHHR